MPKPLMDYTGRCGSCIHFVYLVVNGELKYRGTCECADQSYFMHKDRRGNRYKAQHSSYRQASQKSCRKYREEIKEVNTERQTDCEILQMWGELGDVPFDTDESSGDSSDLVLAEDWNKWHKGTTRDEIWNWFDSNYSRGLYYLLYTV